MAKVDTVCKVDIYEINDDDNVPEKEKHLRIESHWNISKRVVLVFGKKRITVYGDELQRAVDNVMNVGG